MAEVKENKLVEVFQDKNSSPEQLFAVCALQCAMALWARWKEYTSKDLVDLTTSCMHSKQLWQGPLSDYVKYMTNNVGEMAGTLTMVQACFRPLGPDQDRRSLIHQGRKGVAAQERSGTPTLHVQL